MVLFLSSFKGKISDEIFLKTLKKDTYEIFLKICKFSQPNMDYDFIYKKIIEQFYS